MLTNKKEPIFWCKMGMGDNKRNPMVLKKKAIGPGGQVVEISMASGKTITSYLDNSYAQIIKMEKERRGWVWYPDCPKEENKCYAGPLRGKNKRSKDAKFCKDCMEREELIRTRTDMRDASNAEHALLFESRLDKLARVLENATINNQPPKLTDEQLQAAMAAPAVVAEAAKKSKPKTRRSAPNPDDEFSP